MVLFITICSQPILLIVVAIARNPRYFRNNLLMFNVVASLLI